MSGPPLPPLPPAFAVSGSPYPSVPSASRFSSPAAATPPPKPPIPSSVREKELQWRQQNGYPTRPSSQLPPQGQQQRPSSTFAPGQIVSPNLSAPQQQPSFGAPPPPHNGLYQARRSPSPNPAQLGASIQRASSAAAGINRPGSSLSHHNGVGGGGHMPHSYSYADGLAPGAYHNQGRRVSQASLHPSSANGGPADGPPPLSIPLPDMAALAAKRERALASGEERMKLAWAKTVVKYVEREHGDAMSLNDPTLVRYVDEAMAVINRRATANPPDLEGLYLRGDLRASGNFPSYHRKDLKNAFNDFELSGRLGFPPSWFRIGRDYENLNDVPRAVDAYQRGRSIRDIGCIYRLGMAHLLGQLGIKQDYRTAMSLLQEAANGVNEDTPQPSYIYGMLFAGEFSHLNIPADLLRPQPDPAAPHLPATAERTALRYIERAAYFNFAPAQYKLGWAYEYAQLDCAFDPLLSVQYYSLASKGGEIEADMAVSKWFLCGAEGCFDKNESLAFTFAEKAARKGLPSAEFALAYYNEVGVGCEKNVSVARKWYKKAANHGNTDAAERLEALASSSAQTLSRTEHEAHLDSKLTRKHTAAKDKSVREGRGKRPEDRSTAGVTAAMGNLAVRDDNDSPPPEVKELNRKRTMKLVNAAAVAAPAAPAAPGTPAPARGRPGAPQGSGSESSAAPAPSPRASTNTPLPPSENNGSFGMPQSHSSSSLASASSSTSASASAPQHLQTPPPRMRAASQQMGPPASFQGYTLSESYTPGATTMTPPTTGRTTPRPTPPPAASSGAAAAAGLGRPSHMSQSPARHAASAAYLGTPSGMGVAQDRRRSSEASRGGSSGVSAASGGSGSGSGGSGTAAAAPEPKKYNTFAEMGFQSSAASKDKDCVVM